MKHKVAPERLHLTTIAAASYAEERRLQTRNFSVFTFFFFATKYCFRTEAFAEYRVFQEEILIFFLI